MADSATGKIGTRFLKNLDTKLNDLHSRLAKRTTAAQLRKVHGDVRQLCNNVTHSDRSDRRVGVERNKLLQPRWKNEWRNNKAFFNALFDNLPSDVSRQQAESLQEVFIRLVKFRVEGTTDHIRKRLAVELRDAVGDYLSLRDPRSEPGSEYDVLWDFAETELIGKERAVLEEVLRKGGRVELKDLAIATGVDWQLPWDDSWESVQRRLNRKLRKAKYPYILRRRDNIAVLAPSQ